MAIGDKAKAFAAAREKQQAETVRREATEVSPDDLNAQDEAEEAARDARDAAMAVATAETPVSAGAIAMTFEQVMQLVRASQGNAITPDQIAAIVAQATQAGMVAGADRVKPKELKVSEIERKSAFNPLGERDHPRPKLKCHMYFGSCPLGSPKEVSTLTHAEIAALNQIVPGHYRIEKMDGSPMVIEVKGQMNANRKLDRLWILLPQGDENKNLYPPLAKFAAQCCEANRVTPELVA